MICPACGAPVREWQCEAGHRFEEIDGVRRFVSPEFGERIEKYVEAFRRESRSDDRPLPPPETFPLLPDAPEWRDHHEWRLRRADLDVVRGRLGGSPKRVLEVGAWIGWMSHRLTEAGHDVTAVDLFASADDGLAAISHYPIRWRAIQLDPRRLELLGQRFDAIIFNRNLAFLPDPVGAATRAQSMADLVIVTGLGLLRDPSERRAARRRFDERVIARGVEPLFEMPGFLTVDDGEALRRAGFTIEPLPGLKLANAKSRLFARAPWHGTAVWTRE